MYAVHAPPHHDAGDYGHARPHPITIVVVWCTSVCTPPSTDFVCTFVHTRALHVLHVRHVARMLIAHMLLARCPLVAHLLHTC